ncbi:MAG: hypothetical protein WBC67_17160, partial [Candidatus Acidiferrales bacterium]
IFNTSGPPVAWKRTIFAVSLDIQVSSGLLILAAARRIQLNLDEKFHEARIWPGREKHFRRPQKLQ